MALGDFTLFEEFAKQMGTSEHDFGTDAIKVGLVDDTATPLATATTPQWDSWSANEVSGTNYTAGGDEIDNDTYTEAAGVASLAGDDCAWLQSGSGFADARWGIVYNDTHTNDMAIGFVDLGGDVGNVAGDLSIEWTGGVVFTHTVS